MVLDNDCYVFSGGVDLLQFIEEYGCLFYVYDSVIIQWQYKCMENVMKVKCLQFNYVCKVLLNINILKFFWKMGFGLDIVLVQEVFIGIWVGFDLQDIIFMFNCVSLEEIEEVVFYGVKINIDNIFILE